MKRVVTTHGEVHGKAIESHTRRETGGAELQPYLAFGQEFFSESDARALLRAFTAAVETAWPREGGK